MDSSKNGEPKNDLEILSRNVPQSSKSSQESKPLSPILGGGLSNRKFLIGRRLRNNRSRVRLSDRFNESETISPNITLLKQEFVEFNEDSFTVSQNENLVRHIEELEEIENKRNAIYNIIATGSNNDEFCFKTPASPLLGTGKRAKVAVNETIESKNAVESDTGVSELPPVHQALPHCPGFQTATGKSILVPEKDVKTHSKLFEDIMCDPSQKCNSRKNKYAFLSKSKSDLCINNDFLEFDIKLALSESDVNPDRSKKLLNGEHTKVNPHTVSEGFKRHRLSAEGLKNERNILTRRKFRVNSEQFRKIGTEHISLTQEICESGISNTQMLLAADVALSAMETDRDIKREIEQDFKGFNKDEVTAYERIFQRFVDIYRILQNSHRKCSKKSIFSITGESQRTGDDKSNLMPASKRTTDDLPLPPKKRLKSVNSFEEMESLNVENKENEGFVSRSSNFGGFSTASGKSISISECSLKKVSSIFDELESDLSTENLQTKTVLPEVTSAPNMRNSAFGGFSSASGKRITISDSSLQKAGNVFDDMDSTLPKNKLPEVQTKTIPRNTGFNMFSSASNSVTVDSSTTETKPKSSALPGFSSASGRSVAISSGALKKARNIFENLDSEPLLETKTKAISATRSCQKLTKSKIKILETILEFAENEDALESFSKSASSTGKNETTNPLPDIKLSMKPSRENLSAKREDAKPKKRLGVSSCKLLQISNSKLERAKQLFEDDLSKVSPIRPRQSNIYSSTPITPIRVDVRPSTSTGRALCSTPVRQDVLKPSKSFSRFLDGSEITPIKANVASDKVDAILEQPVVVTSPTKGTVGDWLIKLNDDRERLENRLKIILERHRLMQEICKEKPEKDKRPREGVLYCAKATSSRMSIDFFVDKKRPGEEGMNYDLFEINPENAEYLHFKEQYSAVVTTQDGATVIPNLNDIIGLAEIEAAFKAMPGVDPQLVPSGWIRNHYKWIIWKLTSYARMFPVKFGGCLNVENVVQQLKYRYDREVDRAERSALRRIYEKDDVPQKRLILCVSRVRAINANEFELDLTDGWYSIRTVIDEPLNHQVSKGKIQVGTKLLLSGAELLKCDGCFPLETTPLTCLKISYNCTRRAHWNARLGYQRNPEPFPIPIQCVHPSGGPIGAIKVCIIRAYPFKYLEKCGGFSVWRNKRAEERRGQHWLNERCKKLEKIQEDMSREFENSNKLENLQLSRRSRSVAVGRGPVSPRTLYEVLEGSDDPQSVKRNLTSSQQAAMLEYQNNLSWKRQEEIAEKIKQDIDKLKLSKRDVVAVFKLLVVDITGSTDRGFSFFVWRPGESHLHMLREGVVVTIQNVLPRKNGDLSSCSKTMFKLETPAPHLYNDFKRKLTHIAELTRSIFTPTFNEFDTVGLVVHVTVNVSNQEVWLADRLGRLLQVTVHEGPSTCLLLDGLKRGRSTTVCNLVYRGVTENVSQALANHFTVFSCYSQHRHLQEGLDMLKRQLPNDVEALLIDCDRRIEMFKKRNSNANNNLSTIFEDDDENTLVSSRLTSTDVALSLIDMDKYM